MDLEMTFPKGVAAALTGLFAQHRPSLMNDTAATNIIVRHL
jgi:hypothetical protein